MLKAVELLAARRRDDLRVVRCRYRSLPEYHVIFEAPSVDTEVDPPQQIFPANDDEPILTHCKKPCAWTLNRLYPIELPILMKINFSQSSPSSQRPRLVIEEALKKASQFN